MPGWDRGPQRDEEHPWRGLGSILGICARLAQGSLEGSQSISSGTWPVSLGTCARLALGSLNGHGHIWQLVQGDPKGTSERSQQDLAMCARLSQAIVEEPAGA